MKNRWLYFGVILLLLSGCSDEPDCCLPDALTIGDYIGPYTYIHQGKNPVDGAFYSDTTYTDTFTVMRFLLKDSIRFQNGAFYIDFKYRNDQQYTVAPYTSYRLTETDSLYFDSYFYSGTDADHFYSETFSFRGKKK